MRHYFVMVFSLSDVLYIVEQYKYLLLFPITVIEGPIVMVVSGFFTYVGVLNGYIVITILIVGDYIGDILHYFIGKYWQSSKLAQKYGHLVGYNDKSEKFLQKHFEKHTIKTLFAAKFLHGVGTAIQITAGIARVNFWDFLWVSFVTTIPKALILFSLGYFVGGSYVKIDGYLNILAAISITSLVVFILFILINKYLKKYFNRTEEVE